MEDAIAEESIDPQEVVLKRMEILGDEIRNMPRDFKNKYSQEACKRIDELYRLGRENGISRVKILSTTGIASSSFVKAHKLAHGTNGKRFMSDDNKVSTSFFKLLQASSEKPSRRKIHRRKTKDRKPNPLYRGSHQ